MGSRALAMAAIATIPIIAGVSSASAGDVRPSRKVHVTFQPTEVVAGTVEPVCDGTNPPLCVHLGWVTATQTGDLEGKTVQGSALAPAANGALLAVKIGRA